MSDKYLTEKEWKKFATQRYKDDALLDAFAAWAKAEKLGPAEQIEALGDMESAANALLKTNKGDKRLAAYLPFLHTALGKERKLAQKALADADASADEDAEPASALLDPAKLLTQLKLCKRDAERVVQFAFVDGKDKEPATFVLHPKMAGRKLFTKIKDETGGKTGAYGSAWIDGASLILQVEKPLSGLVKKARRPVKAAGFKIARIVLWAADGTVLEQDDEADEASIPVIGETAVTDTSVAEPPVEAAAEDPAKKAYETKLGSLQPLALEALKAQRGDVAKIRAVLGFATQKAGDASYAAALQALDALEKLLGAGAKTAAPVVAGSTPKGEATYLKMRASVTPQLNLAWNLKPDLLGTKIGMVLKAADALSAAGDNPAAIQRLRVLMQEVEAEIADYRREAEARLAELYDKATEIQLALKPDADTVRASVRSLIKEWDLATAHASLDAFERAINAARPIDFEDIGIIQKRRADKLRYENARFARNAEQALMAATRVIDDRGNLVLDSGPLKDLPFVRSDDLSTVAAELAASKEAGLPQSVHALQMLQRLQNDETVRNALNTVRAPAEPSPTATVEERESIRAAQALIRNSLGLADDAPITDVEAKRAAMAALLSQLRQVDVGSCFATATAVRVQRNRPEQFLADMAEMLSTGKLRRQIEHPPGSGTVVNIEVPISREMVGRKLDVTRKNTNLHLNPRMVAGLDALELPKDRQKVFIVYAAHRLRAERAFAKGLGKIARFIQPPDTVELLTQNALNELDADVNLSIEDALKAALAPLILSSTTGRSGRARSDERKTLATDCAKVADDPADSDDFTPEELLKTIGNRWHGTDMTPEILAAAKGAYDTSHDNTLTRAWEYTVASMQEKHPEAATKGKTLAKGIAATLAARAGDAALALIARNSLSAGEAKNQKAVAAEVGREIKERLIAGLEARYDPGVGTLSGATAPDGASSGGGYSLYFRGQKIDGKAQFEAAVTTLMEESKAFFDTNSLAWPAKYVTDAKGLINHLKLGVETKAFREDVVTSLAQSQVSMAPTNSKYAAKVAEAKDDFAKPWTMSGGGGDTTIMPIYENRPQRLVKESSKGFRYKVNNVDTPVANAEGLTHFLLSTFGKMDLGKRMPDGDAAERATVPVGNPIHAFTLRPGNPLIVSALKQGKTPETFIKEFKEGEGEKNRKRRAVDVPIGDLSKGLAADMIRLSVSELPAGMQDLMLSGIKSAITALGRESIPMAQFRTVMQAAIATSVRTAVPGADPVQVGGLATAVSEQLMTADVLLERVIPSEEYAPLIDAAMRKLAVPESAREAVRTAALAALTRDAAVREDVAKVVRTALRAVGFGGGGDDLAAARSAYDALTSDEERRAALTAAGRTVAAPAASFDSLAAEDSAALREHGVSARLDAKLEKALVEPRGVVFADPNWGSGDHVTMFSMVVNPLSDPPAMELWQMNEDGSAPVKLNQAKWIKDGPWHVFAAPDEYGGAIASHKITTSAGASVQWESYRAELRGKLDACYAANKGDLAKMQRILDIADARFGEENFAAADTALNKLAAELEPLEKLAGAVAKGVKTLERVAAEVDKQVKAAKDTPDDLKLARAASGVVNDLIVSLRSQVATTMELTRFLAERKAVLDYIDAESPLGTVDLVKSLTVA